MHPSLSLGLSECAQFSLSFSIRARAAWRSWNPSRTLTGASWVAVTGNGEKILRHSDHYLRYFVQKLIKWALKLKYNKHFRISRSRSKSVCRVFFFFFTQWNFNECTQNRIRCLRSTFGSVQLTLLSFMSSSFGRLSVPNASCLDRARERSRSNKAWSVCVHRSKRNFYLVNYDFVRTIFWLNTRDITALPLFSLDLHRIELMNHLKLSLLRLLSPSPGCFFFLRLSADNVVYFPICRAHSKKPTMSLCSHFNLWDFRSFMHSELATCNNNNRSNTTGRVVLVKNGIWSSDSASRKLRLKSDNELPFPFRFSSSSRFPCPLIPATLRRTTTMLAHWRLCQIREALVCFRPCDQKHKWWAKVKFMCHVRGGSSLKVFSIFNLCFIVHFCAGFLVVVEEVDLTRWMSCLSLFFSLLSCLLVNFNSLVGALFGNLFPCSLFSSYIYFSSGCFSSMMHDNGVVILVFCVLWELSGWKLSNLHFVVVYLSRRCAVHTVP